MVLLATRVLAIGSAHVAEPAEQRGWDIDRPSVQGGRTLGEGERGQSTEVDQGHEDCLGPKFSGTSCPGLYALSFLAGRSP